MADTNKPRNVIQPTTAEAVAEARRLLAEARHAALAVLDRDSGWPLVSRVGIATDEDGTPLILVSWLSAHTGALMKDARCSLLVGEPGKGDPLAYPRAMIRARAEPVDPAGADFGRVRERYLAHQPKASLYAGLPDFRYFRLVPEQVALNGGFGKAFQFAGEALLKGQDAH